MVSWNTQKKILPHLTIFSIPVYKKCKNIARNWNMYYNDFLGLDNLPLPALHFCLILVSLKKPSWISIFETLHQIGMKKNVEKKIMVFHDTENLLWRCSILKMVLLPKGEDVSHFHIINLNIWIQKQDRQDSDRTKKNHLSASGSEVFIGVSPYLNLFVCKVLWSLFQVRTIV